MDILKHEIRKPIVSGLFYPETPEKLRDRVLELLSPFTRGKSGVIMVPHGTWENTGASLASAFAAAADSAPDRILLLGPVHREKSPQNIYLTGKNYFESPLGLIKVDRETCSRLARSSDIFITDDSPHMEEHSLELSIPFIQVLFPETPIIPLLTGQLNARNVKKGAALLTKALGKNRGATLVVLSANLSRFGPSDETEKEARNLLEDLSMPLKRSLAEWEKDGRISSCGIPLLALVSASHWADGTTAALLEEGRTSVKDKNIEKAVFYRGISWD